MTNPRTTVDPQLVARLSGQFASLGEHMRQVSGDLSVLHSQLVAPQSAVPSQPSVHQPQAQQYQSQQYQAQQYQPQPQWGPQPQQVPPAGWQTPQMPAVGRAVAPPPPPSQPVARHVPPSPRPSAAVPPKEPWWQRDGVISRVLAVAGAGVTLVGVVMLLVLAAQAGWFGPELRVGAGAVFSLALVYVGSRVFGRSGGRVGGIAIAATGIAGLYLNVVAVTVIYEWLEPALGLAAAFGIAAAGIALALSWKSQAMATLVLAGVAICSPVVTGGITLPLIAFFTATFIASFPAQLGRDWPILNAARTLPVVLVTLTAIGQASSASVTTADAVKLLVVASIVAVFGIGSSAEMLRRNAADSLAVVALGVVTVPILLVGSLFQTWGYTLVEGIFAIVCVATIAVATWLPNHARAVLAVAGALALVQAVVVPTSSDLRPVALLIVAAALIATAQRLSSKLAYFIGAAFAALAAVRFLIVSPPEALIDSNSATGQFGIVIAGILLTGVAVAMVLVAAELSIAQANLQSSWVVAGIVSLYALTSSTVALGVGTIGGDTGFIAGHCAATIEWMAAAMALLVLGLRSEKHTHTALLAGLSLTAAAVAKLFLFDLVALDGLFRVGAFIVVGLLLLFAGTKYAKVFADRDHSAS